MPDAPAATPSRATEPGIIGPPPPPPPPPPLTAAFFLERADDNVALHVALRDVALLERPDGWWVGPHADRAGLVVVTTEPQHTAEYAARASTPAPSQARPIYGPPSVLSFRVAPGTAAFPLSVEGVLGALANLPLKASPLAAAVSVTATTDAPAASAAVGNGANRAGMTGVAGERARRAAGRAVDPEPALVIDTSNRTRPGGRVGATARQPPPSTVSDAEPEPGTRLPVVVPGVVADHPQPGGTDEPPSTPTTTVVGVPSRLRLGPPGGATRFRHTAAPVEHDGQVEIWHSRFSVVAPDGTVTEPTTPTVVVSAVSSATGTADSAWNALVNDTIINSPLSESLAFSIAARAKLPVSPPTNGSRPLDMARLVVSPFGASVALAGEWPGQTPAAYRHGVVLGRDDEVQVDIVGRLHPLGHRARLTTTTRRLPVDDADATPVVLTTKAQLFVQERVVEYDDGDAVGRALPWQRIEIVNRTSPPGDRKEHRRAAADPTADTYYTLEVGGETFHSHCVGVDRAGHVTTFALPLLFVPDGASPARAQTVWTQLAAGQRAFREVELGGQALGVAPPPDATANGARATASDGEAGTADATTLLTQTVHLLGASGGSFRPQVNSFVGASPVLDALAGGRPEIKTFSYAPQYLASAFAPPSLGNLGNPGELLLTLDRTLTDAARDAVGLVSVPQLPVQGISRLVGAVAASGNTPQEVAANLAKAAAGAFDPQAYFGDSPATLLGIFPIRELLALPRQADQALTLAKDAPRQVVETIDGLRTTTVTWSTTLVPLGGTFSPTAGAAFLSLDADTSPINLAMHQQTSVGADGTLSSRSTTTVAGATLTLGAAGKPLLKLPIRSVVFESTDGAAPAVDVDLGKVDFFGPLAFVSALADLIPSTDLAGARTRPGAPGDGARGGAPTNGPYVDVDAEKVSAGLALAVPDLAIGMFSLQDLAFRSQLNLYFTREPELVLDFATPENPFRATVSAIGGGGWIQVAVATSGIRRIAGELQFGAAIAIDIGIAAGRASVMAGVFFAYTEAEGLALTGYLRAEGHVEVLKIVSMSLVMEIYLAYEASRLRGGAEVSFSIRLLFFRKTVKTRVEREFAGSNTDPSFAELMAPADWPDDEQLPWDAYCQAFAAP